MPFSKTKKIKFQYVKDRSIKEIKLQETRCKSIKELEEINEFVKKTLGYENDSEMYCHLLLRANDFILGK